MIGMQAHELEAVAAAALGSPLIAGLTPGPTGDVAAERAGRRVLGVRECDGTVEVHVVARYGTPLLDVADVVRAAVAPHTGGRPVAVFVDDIEPAPDPATQSPPPRPGGSVSLPPTVVGLFIGLILGLALAFDGFGSMLIVAFCGAAGFLVAKVLQGEIDITPYLGAGRRSRR